MLAFAGRLPHLNPDSSGRFGDSIVFISTTSLSCIMLMKTCGSVGSFTSKSCDCVLCWTKEQTNIYWILRGKYGARYLITSFYWNIHLEGGKGGDTISFRWESISMWSQFLRSQLRSQTGDCRLRSCFKCCSSFHDTLLSSLSSVTNSFTILAYFTVVSKCISGTFKF